MESNLSSDVPTNSDESLNQNEATPAVVSTDVGGTKAECDSSISSTTPDKFSENVESSNAVGSPGLENDADFFTSELSMSNMSSEKISENVEDIVQDLENLLGESNDSYRFTRDIYDSSRTEPFEKATSSKIDDVLDDFLQEDVAVSFGSAGVQDTLGRCTTELNTKKDPQQRPASVELNHDVAMQEVSSIASEALKGPSHIPNDVEVADKTESEAAAAQVDMSSAINSTSTGFLDVDGDAIEQFTSEVAVRSPGVEPQTNNFTVTETVQEIVDENGCSTASDSVVELPKVCQSPLQTEADAELPEVSQSPPETEPVAELSEVSQSPLESEAVAELRDVSRSPLETETVTELAEVSQSPVAELPEVTQSLLETVAELPETSQLTFETDTEKVSSSLTEPKSIPLEDLKTESNNEELELSVAETTVEEIPEKPFTAPSEPSTAEISEQTPDSQETISKIAGENETKASNTHEATSSKIVDEESKVETETSELANAESTEIQPETQNEPVKTPEAQSVTTVETSNEIIQQAESVESQNELSIVEDIPKETSEAVNESVSLVEAMEVEEGQNEPSAVEVEPMEVQDETPDLENTLAESTINPEAEIETETPELPQIQVEPTELPETQMEVQEIEDKALQSQGETREEPVQVQETSRIDDVVEIAAEPTKSSQATELIEEIEISVTAQVADESAATEQTESLPVTDSVKAVESPVAAPITDSLAPEIVESQNEEKAASTVEDSNEEAPNEVNESADSEFPALEIEEDSQEATINGASQSQILKEVQEVSECVVNILQCESLKTPTEIKEPTEVEESVVNDIVLPETIEAFSGSSKRLDDISANEIIENQKFDGEISEISSLNSLLPETDSTEIPDTSFTEEHNKMQTIAPDDLSGDNATELLDELMKDSTNVNLEEGFTNLLEEADKEMLPELAENADNKSQDYEGLTFDSSNEEVIKHFETDFDNLEKDLQEAAAASEKYLETHSVVHQEQLPVEPTVVVTQALSEEESLNQAALESLNRTVEELNNSTLLQAEITEKDVEEDAVSTKDSELAQPLTVEIEDSGEVEVKKGDEGKGVESTEVKESVCEADVQRAPLKMTITKHENVHSILKIYDPNEETSEELHKVVIKSDEDKIPKLTIKNISQDTQHSPRQVKSVKSQDSDRQDSPRSGKSQGSPKITIKPIIKPESLSPVKLTLRSYPKVDAEEPHHSPKITIKPIVKSDDSHEDKPSPRITIKPIIKPVEEATHEEKHSPRITIKPIPDQSEVHSPRITIKPIVKPHEEISKSEKEEERQIPKITIKPVIKPPEEEEKQVKTRSEERSSPKIIIKPIVKSNESEENDDKHTRISIKPVVKPSDEASNEKHSPKITIKPIVKPDSELEAVQSPPRITIKPIVKPPDADESASLTVQPFKLNIKPVLKPTESNLPKVTIKPVQKCESQVETIELVDFEDQIKQERIVLKIPKQSKRERESEKLKKIKVKLSKDQNVARIIPESAKRPAEDELSRLSKHFKPDLMPEISISLVSSSGASGVIEVDDSDSDIKTQEPKLRGDVEVISADSGSLDVSLIDQDPLAAIPVFQIAVNSNAPPTVVTSTATSTTAAPLAPAPRKRGRPRKVPLEVREEFKPVVEVQSTRPKRSCRGTSVTEALGIKPRKPREPKQPKEPKPPKEAGAEPRAALTGSGRGRKRSSSPRVAASRPAKETKASKAKAARLELKQQREAAAAALAHPLEVITDASVEKISENLLIKQELIKEHEQVAEQEVIELIKDEKKDELKEAPKPAAGGSEVVIYEEETRMSAENSSRAQTPAKQVLTSSEVVEESQSSVQSNATTESGDKAQKRKGPRLEVHQEPEGEIISADKLAEYCWGGGGPYMLQEQVAQFLGIKSFKRKYPGIHRRPVDMQERDFIRESCLASEPMCDMGLTAVRSEDILDIMYTDFQNKYEEYCKHQRDRQAKDVSNKQKALSLAASQEKNKLDIVEQAVQSAFQWNANFNKTRREQRKACMDLQTFTVHYPKGKMKQVNKPPVGSYPLALVPGQFTDYYKNYNTYELAELPLSTTGCNPLNNNIVQHDTEESQSDGSGSDSDSSSSDSDTSDSSSEEDCKMCRRSAAAKKVPVPTRV